MQKRRIQQNLKTHRITFICMAGADQRHSGAPRAGLHHLKRQFLPSA
jgi:hypothetical protein